MAKKRVSATISAEAQEKILQWAEKNNVEGGFSAALESIAATALDEKENKDEGGEAGEDEIYSKPELEIDFNEYVIGAKQVACVAAALGVCAALAVSLFRRRG